MMCVCVVTMHSQAEGFLKIMHGSQLNTLLKQSYYDLVQNYDLIYLYSYNCT